MSVKTRLDNEHHALIMAIDSQFDDSVATEFAQAYSVNNYDIKNYYIDLQKVAYLDSSIMGSLLQFSNFLQERRANGYIINMSEEILEEFRVLNLHKIFKPEFCAEKYGVIWVCHGAT